MTKLGFDVIASGGYRKYFEETESEKELNNEIKRLTVKELKGNIFHLKIGGGLSLQVKIFVLM